MSRCPHRASLLCLLLLVAETADAHLVNSGMGPFYDGVLHLLLSPGDWLGLVALSLLAGLRGARAGRLTVVTLPLAWLAGGIIGLNLPFSLELPWLSAASFMILGMLVALDTQRLPPAGVAGLAVLYGALHGMLNGSALTATGAGMSSLWGVVTIVLVTVLLVAALVASLRSSAARIVVRVAGSWVAAIGILTLGWLAAA